MTDNGINGFIRAFDYLELSLAPGTEDQHRGTINYQLGDCEPCQYRGCTAPAIGYLKDPNWGVMLRCRAHAGCHQQIAREADHDGGQREDDRPRPLS
jgi:hypothetical protein